MQGWRRRTYCNVKRLSSYMGQTKRIIFCENKKKIIQTENKQIHGNNNINNNNNTSKNNKDSNNIKHYQEQEQWFSRSQQ